MNTLGNTLVAALLVLGLFLCWRMDNLSSQLDMEKQRHESTRKDLRAVLEESERHRVVLEETRLSATAHADNAAACLAREARAQAADEERAAIMRKAAPRSKTPKDKVLDDETRSRIITRLNRGL